MLRLALAQHLPPRLDQGMNEHGQSEIAAALRNGIHRRIVRELRNPEFHANHPGIQTPLELGQAGRFTMRRVQIAKAVIDARKVPHGRQAFIIRRPDIRRSREFPSGCYAATYDPVDRIRAQNPFHVTVRIG